MKMMSKVNTLTIGSTSQEQKTDKVFERSVAIKVEVTDEMLSDVFNENNANTTREKSTDKEPSNTECDFKIFKPDIFVMTGVKDEDKSTLNVDISKPMPRGDFKPQIDSMSEIKEDLSLGDTFKEKICSAGDHELLMTLNETQIENKLLSNRELSRHEMCNKEFTYSPQKKYGFFHKEVKTESAINEDRFVTPEIETLKKEETSEFSNRLDASIKTEIFKQEHDLTTDNDSDTFPPDSYHALLKKANEFSKEIKEEKPFFFRDAMRIKTVKALDKSYQNITPSSDHDIQNGKRYSCEMCNASFKENSHISKHVLIHIESQKSKCCHSDSHDSQIHGKVKCYSCQICNKQFTQKSHLLPHKLIHEKVKPYSCEICNKQFTHKSYLLKHKRIHEKVNRR